MRTQGHLKKNVRQITKVTGIKTCQMEMRLVILRKQVCMMNYKAPELDQDSVVEQAYQGELGVIFM